MALCPAFPCRRCGTGGTLLPPVFSRPCFGGSFPSRRGMRRACVSGALRVLWYRARYARRCNSGRECLKAALGEGKRSEAGRRGAFQQELHYFFHGGSGGGGVTGVGGRRPVFGQTTRTTGGPCLPPRPRRFCCPQSSARRPGAEGVWLPPRARPHPWGTAICAGGLSLGHGPRPGVAGAFVPQFSPSAGGGTGAVALGQSSRSLLVASCIESVTFSGSSLSRYMRSMWSM
mgnify:FL=1